MVIKQGDKADLFYIVKGGEAIVTVTENGLERKLNHLFRGDFFGEKALLNNAPRTATVTARGFLTCLLVTREVFTEVLGPLEDIMKREKSDEVTEKRMESLGDALTADSDFPSYDLLDWSEWLEADFGELGAGAFSTVKRVKNIKSNQIYALKCIRKIDLLHCPDHVFNEKSLTKELIHPFIVHVCGSSSDAWYLYLLMEHMGGGDLMDHLVAITKLISTKSLGGCIGTEERMLVGFDEKSVQFFIACMVLSIEYLHRKGIVYRDLKPENILLGIDGYPKLADFGFAKAIGARQTFTFCGTPSYLAPEAILSKGYGVAVDWWSLGAVMFTLLTGSLPYGSADDDEMVVMGRIVKDSYQVKYPSYLSDNAVDLMQGLMERKPHRRLGNRKGRSNDIKSHPFFSGMDWSNLYRKSIQPPFDPMSDGVAKKENNRYVQMTFEAPESSWLSRKAQTDRLFANW